MERPDASARAEAGLIEDAEPAPDAEPVPDGGTAATLLGPEVLDLPYVVAGQGGSALRFELRNEGDQALEGLSFWLSEGPFVLSPAPAQIEPRSTIAVELSYEGRPIEAIDRGTLRVSAGMTVLEIPVYGVTGSAALPSAQWTSVPLAQGLSAGQGATLALPTAPFPAAGRSYTDASVRIFVPSGFRDRGATTFVLHFHGFGTTLASTLASHRYQEQVYASGANVVLLVPQGPVQAQSGDFGKLMSSAGTEALLQEALVVLYREGLLQHPTMDAVILSAHSGGYQAVAANLDERLPVTQVELFDALYGYASTFRGFVEAGGRLRSNYSSGGGTVDLNQQLAVQLEAEGLTVNRQDQLRALRDPAALITFADTAHNDVTRHRSAYAEWLRFAAPGRAGPRIELRSAAAEGGEGLVTWLPPRDPALLGVIVEFDQGRGFSAVAEAGPEAREARFPLPTGGRVRLRPRCSDLSLEATLPSDSYRIDPNPEILVVDHFDRILGGGYAGLHHDFAAQVAESLGRPVATIGHRALEEDGFELGPWPTVLWLLGDQSADDRTFTAVEQTAVRAYLSAGGRLLVSGSEVGYDLVAKAHGASFLADVLGAQYVADASPDPRLVGVGPLSGLGTFDLLGPGAPYPVAYPDVLSPAPGAVRLLEYPDGRAAAVGHPGSVAVLGFPLESLGNGARASLLVALLQFLGV